MLKFKKNYKSLSKSPTKPIYLTKLRTAYAEFLSDSVNVDEDDRVIYKELLAVKNLIHDNKMKLRNQGRLIKQILDILLNE